MSQPVARLKITLQDFEPAVWRHVCLPASETTLALHDVIQAAFGREDPHLFEFSLGDRAYGMPKPEAQACGRRVVQATSEFRRRAR